MSAISREDLRTILLFGIHISKVDNNFDVWEKQILKRFSDAINLSEEERGDIANREVSLRKGLDSLTSAEARNLLIKTLCAVSYADGSTHPSELDFIEKVITRAGATVMVLPREEWGLYEKEIFEDLQQFT